MNTVYDQKLILWIFTKTESRSHICFSYVSGSLEATANQMTQNKIDIHINDVLLQLPTVGKKEKFKTFAN